MANTFYKPVFLRKTKDADKSRCQFSRVYTDMFFELSKQYTVDHGEFMEFYPPKRDVVADAITFSLAVNSDTYYFNVSRSGELSIYKAQVLELQTQPFERFTAIYPEKYDRKLVAEWFCEKIKSTRI